jgi:multidrug efflux pump subunit AcrB
MWIVKLALDRPYTFLVLALLILLLSPVAIFILQMPVDIFPNINIPVVSIIWNYTGFSPKDMDSHIVSPSERVLTTTVNDIEHIESQSLNGVAVVKVYFHPAVKIDMAVAQITAVNQTILRSLPAGTTPPLILQYSASSVPILQLGVSSKTLPEQTLNDLSLNVIRLRLTTIQGAAIPYPYGGKQRQIMVDLDIPKLQARGLTAGDVVTALGNQNLILPSGTVKIGTLEYQTSLNGSPQKADDLNDVPIRAVNGTIIYLRDVAHVHDGFSPQTNVVRQDGLRGTLISILKNGNVSTLNIVSDVRAMLPKIQASLPKDISVRALFDQSIFVRASISGVIREGVIAACLTALMILLFLGDWRSTLIIAVSIPLSVLSSILILDCLGETINIMTLGGLALAVGILVDDATVTIENIDNHLSQGKDLRQGILDGASQIAVPAFVSSLCICIVFVPMFLLSGVAKFLFVPLAESVVFAVMSSYVLSRTLVPTLAMYLLKDEHPKPPQAQGGDGHLHDSELAGPEHHAPTNTTATTLRHVSSSSASPSSGRYRWKFPSSPRNIISRHRPVSSDASSADSSVASSDCAITTGTRWTGPWARAGSSFSSFSPSAWGASSSFLFWARISSPTSMPASSNSISGRRRAPGSRRPRSWPTRSRPPSAGIFLTTISTASWTTWACPTAASIYPTRIRA